ncbi:hypothetical protein BIFGAL_03897 [Bifidobacterium gallicum DSM 20093 = LMG 11596]|uniref:Uncharacterized protein n=1 Tax=Bifidobacterium gallicum DSM 20093 = LMG 11596 TaxID=561180 RepID=D1NVK8_9BIFI|nr:hypothetical protein BIFGAL_03897 [Bifidobacterium gallicum DSM 20093 = LMG 11596]
MLVCLAVPSVCSRSQSYAALFAVLDCCQVICSGMQLMQPRKALEPLLRSQTPPAFLVHELDS